MRKRPMYICRKCQGNCAAGELREGLCSDCIEKRQMKPVSKVDMFGCGSLGMNLRALSCAQEYRE